MRTLSRTVLLLTTALTALLACSSDHPSGGASSTGGPGASDPSTPLTPTTTPLPTTQATPYTYVAKVKNILVGLPPTDDEVKAVVADPSRLSTLIDGWMKEPQYEDKMLRFFQLAFQQTQIVNTDFLDQVATKVPFRNKATAPLIIANISESMARTALALNASGRPLTEAVTTHSYMMTTALMNYYAFLDAWQVDDDGNIKDRFSQKYPAANITISAKQNIPIADSLNPASPNFMHFYEQDLASQGDNARPGCFDDPITIDTPQLGLSVELLLLGEIDAHKGSQGHCDASVGKDFGPLTADDFSDWRMVTIRAPKAAEDSTTFFDLASLRTAQELVLRVPRVGFFTTPAFAANWHTNTSNQMRVTTNQTLIVALGAAIDGTDPTSPASTPGLDQAHAGEPACYSCHKTLDPTRSILAANLSWSYNAQTDKTWSGQKGLFAFRGVTKPVATLDDFASALATHPLFAQGWVQKLCYYVDSTACDPADPELERIVGVFQSSSYSWNALVKELMASPLTTNAKPTKTQADEGQVIAVSRRDHLCAALDARLGFGDICGLASAHTKATTPNATIVTIALGLPSDGYGRGSVAPVLPNDPTLFYRAGLENICEAASTLVVDPATATPGAKVWSSGDPSAAIDDFVGTMMALVPSDPRAEPAKQALASHFTSAVASGATKTAALRSAFVAACLAPSSISIGL